MIPDRIEREIFIAAPVERVWSVITEAKHIGTWFGNVGATIDLRPGGVMTTAWRDLGTMHGRVERVEPPRFFSYRWIRGSGAEPSPSNSTLVEFTLTPDEGGTTLRVAESGLRALEMTPGALMAEVKSHTDGWRFELDELRDYAARIAA
jgi:uncharacterized protein YndB with AHSA1/START domain